ncbi:hypothetical protein QFC19_003728 [Naganishia cerealis]|uniref:Uncharacterized protein n=1 Tax=Naganishia cerealis TaxID=610337 RepID=A0ACC2VZU7_9TREE|nr:hypothetical protein QFC19_003728 [Naganishia cerealis]
MLYPTHGQEGGTNEGTESGTVQSVAVGMTRKTSTSKAFANLFLGRKKKATKNEIESTLSSPRKSDRGDKELIKCKDISLVSLEGEVVEYGRNGVDDTITVKAMRKRALSTSSPESRQTSNNRTYQPGDTTSLKPTFPMMGPIRRVSESDAEQRDRQTNPTNASAGGTFRRPMLTLNLYTHPTNAPQIVGSPVSPMGTPTMSPILRDPHNHDLEGEAIQPPLLRHVVTTASGGEPCGIFETGTLRQDTLFDPAQFEDGSDSESALDRQGTLFDRSSRSPGTAETRGERVTNNPVPVDGSSVPTTPALDEIPITVISASDSAPLMQRSESGPPPTFKFIPATPIAPEDGDDAKEHADSDDTCGKDDSVGGAIKKQKKNKNRNSLPPVPVNPIRPRKLELVLELNTAPEQTSREESHSEAEPLQASTPISALDSLLNDNAFYGPDPNEAFYEDDLLGEDNAYPPLTSSSPSDLAPVRSPSRESLLRNTVPLRLSTSPKLVTAANVCRPVNSSLSMASSCQSSHALTLSTSSTIASSFNSFDTMDLEDVESALGTMLASLSTRPSLASRLTLTDPLLAAESRVVKSQERIPTAELGLSALGFGAPSAAPGFSAVRDVDHDATPTRREHRRSWATQPDSQPLNAHNGPLYIPTHHESHRTEQAEVDANDSETDSIFSDIDDLGSVSIAVVQKSPRMFASPRTLSIGHTDVK